MSLLREPLLHFLAIGAGLFLLADGVRGSTREDPHAITVTRRAIEDLSAGFAGRHGRPPSSDELAGAIREHVREEVYYREALSLGLDQDDPVIRQRLREKMEFVSDDVAGLGEPTEEDLRRYLAEHPEKFRVEPRLTFAHVYLDPARRPETAAKDATQLLARLHGQGATNEADTLGDPFLLEREFAEVSRSQVAMLFGEPFASALGELELGRWSGPVESGYGLHLVLVRDRTEGRVPTLEEVREDVRREWATGQRREANERFYSGVLARYAVTVEGD